MRRPVSSALLLIALLGFASPPAEAKKKKPSSMEEGIKLDKETEDLIRQERDRAEGKTTQKEEKKKEEKKPEKKAEKKEEKKPEPKKLVIREVPPEEREPAKKAPPKLACDCPQFSCTAPDGMRSMTGPCNAKCGEGQAADCQCGACGDDGHVGSRNSCQCR